MQYAIRTMIMRPANAQPTAMGTMLFVAFGMFSAAQVSARRKWRNLSTPSENYEVYEVQCLMRFYQGVQLTVLCRKTR